MELDVCILRLYVIILLSVAVESEYEYSFLHPPETSPCQDPQPVPNAYRHFNQNGDVVYSCYDGCQRTSGSSQLACRERQYNQAPPICTLVCGTPVSYVDQTVNYTDNTGGSVARYACKSDYSSSNNTIAKCDAFTGCWTYSPLFCFKKLKLSATSLPKAVDENKSTCESLTNFPGHWTIDVDLQNATSVDIYRILMNIRNVSPTGAMLNISVSKTGQNTFFKLRNILEKNSDLDLTYDQVFLPWGTIVAFFTDAKQLSLCQVEIFGRPFSGTCPSPPAEPRLKMTSNLTRFDGIFKLGDRVHYECDDHLYYAGGDTWSQCLIESVWSAPQLTCSDDTNFAATAGSVTIIGTHEDNPNLHDDNSSTCVSLKPETSTFVVTLNYDVEVHYVTVTTSGGNVTCATTVTTLQGSVKTCVPVTSDLPQTFVMSCPLYLGVSQVHVNVTSDFATNQSAEANICEIRVLGANYTDKVLECIRTPRGNDYRGRLRYTEEGSLCLRWDGIHPELQPSNFPDYSLQDTENFCRNPVTFDKVRPWCYISSTETGYCPVISCDNFFKSRNDSATYRGTLSKTTSSAPCIAWTSPGLPAWHTHSFSDGSVSAAGANCRNPGTSQTTAWCYVSAATTATATATTTYGQCDVPDPPEVLTVYEEPVAQKMALSVCLPSDDTNTLSLSDMADSLRRPCSQGTKPVRLCIRDTGIAAVRIWCADNFCPEPAPVANAYRNYDQTGLPGSRVSYSCYYGYRLTSGDLQRTCMKYGQYTGIPPVCTLNCRLLPTSDILLDNVIHSLSNISDEVFGLNKSSIFCDATSGQWEVRNGSKVNVSTCASPPAIPRLLIVNETIANSTYMVGDNVTYACAKGFYVQGGLATSTCGWDFQFRMDSKLICSDEENKAYSSGRYIYQTTDRVQLLPILMDDRDDTCQTFNSSDLSFTLVFWRELEVRLVTMTFAEDTAISRIALNIESRSNNSKECNDTGAEQVLVGGVTVLIVSCVSMPVGKAVNINISLSTKMVSLCEIRAFGRKYDEVLGCTQTAEGYDYKGHVSTRLSGEWCSPWADHYRALNVSLKDELWIFPDAEATDLHDFCRRPTQHFEWVGCYSSGGRGNCTVNLCSSDCTLDAPLARDYTGTIDSTMKRLKCISWDSPGLPFLRKEDFPDGNMSHAYCRNPGASQSKPWCYTNATTLDFGYCAVPECKPTCPEPAPVANAYRSYRSKYVGTSVWYTCYHGYDNTAGNLSRVCQSDGTYSGSAPVCEFSACLWASVSTNVGHNTTVGCSTAPQTAVCDRRTRRLVTSSCPGVCFDAPAMPRLQINVTLTVGVPQVTRYVCAEGLYPVGGNATVRCLPNGEWENVTLQCEGWTNYGLHAAPVTEEGEDSRVTDDNTDTCSNVCSPLRLDLRDDLEVKLVTLHFAASPADHPVLLVEVETSQGTRKGCSQSDVYDVTTVVTCTQAPVGKAVHVTFTELSNCSDLLLCEVRIFGRPFSSGKLLLIQEKMNFWSATERCRKEGGDLLSVHDSQTQDIAFSLCRKAATLCWVGLYQGLYYEWTDSSVVDYKTYEWNNTADGRCLAINQNNWQNRQCTESLFSVCNVTHHNTSGTISFSYSDALECLQWSEGREYKGNINFTKSGYSCLRWDMVAATENVSLNDLTDEGLEEAGNKCRNPLGFNRTQPWCFVNGTEKEWEYCNIPYCSDICQIKGGLVEFSGPVNYTKDNVICIPWSSTRFINPEDFPKGNEDLKLNFCRNPTNSQTQPWCYTDSNGTTYQHCDIPECTSTVLFYKEKDQLNLEKCIGPETVVSSIISARRTYQQLCLTTEELSLTILCYTNNHYFAAIQIQCDLCPDLPVFSSVSLQTGVYKVGTSWTYTCAEGRYPVSGYGTYECQLTTQWIPPNPVLLCKNWINYAHGATLNTASTPLTDDNINTCTDFPTNTYQLQMTTELEVSLVTFVLNQTQAFSGLVTVTSAKMTKACSNVTVYGTLAVVTCEQAPVTRSLTLAVSTGVVLHLCEWRVFGRPVTPDGDPDFLECLQSETGTEYKGDVSFTRFGVTCLRWDSVNSTSAFDFPDWNLQEAADKCRNPGNLKTSPWCYVNTTRDPQPQLCFIPKCSNWCDVTNGTTDYNGNVNYSPSRPCSQWSQVMANQTVQLFRGEDFPDGSTDHNFCRNPDNSPTGPWCYTDLNGTSQSCSVPHCPTTLVSINESDPLFDTVTSCFLDTGVEASYSYVRANASARCFILSLMYVTVLCKTNTSHLAAVQIECDHCPSLPIASGLVVEQRKYAPGTKVSFTCNDTRVPVGGGGTLLCSLSLQWEVVSRDLRCQDWQNYGNLMVASANESKLVDGDVTTCVTLPADWYFLTLSETLEVTVVTFHFKEYSSNVLPLAVTVGMTTNASGQKACTALSIGTVSVFRCQQGPVGDQVAVHLPACTLCEWGVYGRNISSGASNALQCLQSPAGVEYRGDINFTLTGLACLRWDAKLMGNPSPNDFPDRSVAEAGNKCRNPVSQLKERPWCYVNGGSQDWEYCCIPSCEATCWIQNGVTSYYGDVSVTSNNKSCVSWKNALASEAVPSFWPWDFPDLSTDHNFCRNPNNSQTGPWCYTDLAGTSQSCSIPQCPTELIAYYEDDPYRLSVKWCYTADGVATLQNVGRDYQSTCLTTQQPFLTTLCATDTSFIAVHIPCQLPSSWSSSAMSSAASTIFSDYASTTFYVASSSSLVGEHTVRPSSALSHVTGEPSTEPAVGYTATSTLDYTSTVETSTNSHHFDPITSVTTRSYRDPGSTFAATPILTIVTTSILTNADTPATTTAYTSTPIITITSTPTTAATSTPITSATSTPTSAATSTPTTAATSTPITSATSTPNSAATSTTTTAATSTPITSATSTPNSAATSGATGTTPSGESFGRRQAMCPCNCALRSVMKNMSEVQALVTQQQKELAVDKHALSSTRRLKACEPNHDIYAVATGSVLGVAAVTVVVLFFVMSDLVAFSIILRRVCRRWWQRWRRR